MSATQQSHTELSSGVMESTSTMSMQIIVWLSNKSDLQSLDLKEVNVEVFHLEMILEEISDARQNMEDIPCDYGILTMSLMLETAQGFSSDCVGYIL